MDIIRLYNDYSVTYYTEGKNVSPGWINVKCPWCNDPSNHMGFNPDENYFTCWRCGAHKLIPTLARLLMFSEKETYRIVKEYGLQIREVREEPDVKIGKNIFRFPSGSGPLEQNHKRYLENRNFDPDKLEKLWGLMGTGPVSKLEYYDYKHRIVIPFTWDDKPVSFDSRDITGKDPGRYRACPREFEIIPHKSIVYGNQKYWKDSIICVEGPTDVWRLGTNSVCTSGIKYTSKQVRILAKSFKRVFVIFDDEEQATAQAQKLVNEIRFLGTEAILIESIISSDPGSMKQEDADYLVKQLMK